MTRRMKKEVIKRLVLKGELVSAVVACEEFEISKKFIQKIIRRNRNAIKENLGK